jgi:hypothetical protein
VAERIGDIERVANALDHLRTVQFIAGQLAESQASLAAERSIADSLRQPSQVWQVHSSHAILCLAVGKFGEAEELIERAFEVGEHAQPSVALPAWRLQRWQLYDFQGRVDDVAPEIRDLVVEFPTRPAFRCALAHVRRG